MTPADDDTRHANAAALLRESIIWACRPPGHRQGRPFNLPEVGARLLAITATIYPEALEGRTQDEFCQGE